MKPKLQTCLEKGAVHTWERCGETSEIGAFLFRCSTCTAWAWASKATPSRITPYVRDPFRPRKANVEPTITARPKEPPEVDYAGRVDTRGDRVPRSTGKADYTPRFSLSDWDEAEWSGPCTARVRPYKTRSTNPEGG
jgi:hypothetical protein